MNQYIKKQKIAKEAREKKESEEKRNITLNWTNRITTPKEFNFNTSVTYYINLI